MLGSVRFEASDVRLDLFLKNKRARGNVRLIGFSNGTGNRTFSKEGWANSNEGQERQIDMLTIKKENGTC